jgi:RimJ/RimL family protein N-acetyltransferase
MKLKKIILKEKRVILKPYTLKNAKEFSELGESNWRVGKINTVAKATKWIKNSWTDDSCYFGIFLKENNKLIGNAELCHMKWWENQAGEICYMINKKFRRQGYATEASRVLINYCFKKLKFHKVYADTEPKNLGSQKTLKKLGFKLEGKIRERRKIKGKWTDELDYGLLKGELKR